MPDQLYNWTRFWVPRETTPIDVDGRASGRRYSPGHRNAHAPPRRSAGISISLADGGYLYAPYTPSLQQLKDLIAIPCLALLSEPGMGKTCTLKAEKAALEALISNQGEENLWLDLRSYSSEERLIRNLFEGNVFRAWAQGSHRLHVFLDSLDEALLRIETIAALLVDELRQYPVERLSLVIACRTAEWPHGLEQGLKKLWGETNVAVYELAPLRRMDVIEAARANGVDPESFLAQVDQRQVVPLAIKPVTLDFLLRAYQHNSELPGTQAELYRKGLRLLCEEINESRRDTRRVGVLSAEQRMIIAARIAAVTIFANKDAIWTGVDRGDVLEEDVTISDLLVEEHDLDAPSLTATAIREVLDTGLFSTRGQHRMGWAHQTYAEFLAAWYLVHRNATLPQITSLLVHPGDVEGRLVPQLHETAAWLAGMRPDVFREIIQRDLQVLLRSDVAAVDPADRKTLVEHLLRLFDEGRLMDRDRGGYSGLAHPELAEQLRPYIVDRTKGWLVRRVAVDIAEACGLRSLQDDLLRIALDPEDFMPVRVNVAYALTRIGDEQAKAQLKPLVFGAIAPDPDDELKGCALDATWPLNISADDLFRVLHSPRNPNLLGAYSQFIEHKLAEHLQPADLPVALRWVAEQPSRYDLPLPFKTLVNQILLQSWEHLDSPRVLEAFAKAVLSRLAHFEPIIVRQYGDQEPDSSFRRLVAAAADKRHRVVETLLPALSDKDVFVLAALGTPLVLAEDMPWLIQRLRSTTSEETRRKLFNVIQRAFDRHNPDHIDLIYDAGQSEPILAETLVSAFGPVELNSVDAERMKKTHQMQLELERRGAEQVPEVLPVQERVTACLDRFEQGELAAWWQLDLELMIGAYRRVVSDELTPNLTDFPGWSQVDAGTKSRIVDTAKRYLLEADPEIDEWLGTNKVYRPAFAGYRALRLLVQEDSRFVESMPSTVWEKWAPILLAFPRPNDTGEQEIQRQLICMAYSIAPHEILNTLMILIDKENRESDHVFIISRVEECWDEQLSLHAMRKVQDGELKASSLASVLSVLLDQRHEEAKAFAERLLAAPLPTDEDERQRAVLVAGVLFSHAADAGWPAIWDAMQQDGELGREITLHIAHANRNHEQNLRSLSEGQLADLYVWLERQFPSAQDPRPIGAHMVEPRESVAEWKQEILIHLQQRGTAGASDAIRRIIQELPEFDWLKWKLLEAQGVTRRATWIPPTPGDIFLLTRNEQARLVQSGEQLLDAIIESLERLEARLLDETPAAIDLWNELVNRQYKPKDEERLSDYVKRHLQQDLTERGIVINREVQIRRGATPGAGERTDIHVDAVTRQQDRSYDTITVIIETKGNWHDELLTAMETQLVNRYLRDNECRHGLYLVGWFNCEVWSDKPRDMTLEELQAHLDTQAQSLSTGGLVIKAFVLDVRLR